jgi:HSP20 family protein
MALIPWRNKGRDGGALAPLSDLRHEIDRMFDAFTRDPWGSLSEFGGSKAWFPAIDVAENDREVIVRAEVPGIDPKELDITVTSDRLTLSGEKKETTERKDKDFYQSETRYGSFSRSVDLPSGVDTEHVTAEHTNGVVTIKLKKTAAAATKKIQVKTT